MDKPWLSLKSLAVISPPALVANVAISESQLWGTSLHASYPDILMATNIACP